LTIELAKAGNEYGSGSRVAPSSEDLTIELAKAENEYGSGYLIQTMRILETVRGLPMRKNNAVDS
jgi:hypothetical protein